MRILDLTHDSHVEAATDPAVRVTRAAVGGSNAPWGRRAAVPAGAAAAALGRLAQARAGGYDWVIAPPVLVDRKHENPAWQRALKAIVAGAAERPAAGRAAYAALLRGRCRYAIVDIADRRTLSPFALGVIRPRHYFKRNLVAGSAPAGLDAWTLPISLPLAALRERVAEVPSAERPVDLFVAGDYKNEPRRLLREIAERLGERGRNVDILDRRVGYDEYLARLGRSRLAGTAEGWGYHTWRMYEAAALGAVPIVTPTPEGMWSWFADGENCLVLEPGTGAEAEAERLDALLGDAERAGRIAAAARARAERHHDAPAVADWLVARLRDEPGPPVPGGEPPGP